MRSTDRPIPPGDRTCSASRLRISGVAHRLGVTLLTTGFGIVPLRVSKAAGQRVTTPAIRGEWNGPGHRERDDAPRPGFPQGSLRRHERALAYRR